MKRSMTFEAKLWSSITQADREAAEARRREERQRQERCVQKRRCSFSDMEGRKEVQMEGKGGLKDWVCVVSVLLLHKCSCRGVGSPYIPDHRFLALPCRRAWNDLRRRNEKSRCNNGLGPRGIKRLSDQMMDVSIFSVQCSEFLRIQCQMLPDARIFWQDVYISLS